APAVLQPAERPGQQVDVDLPLRHIARHPRREPLLQEREAHPRLGVERIHAGRQLTRVPGPDGGDPGHELRIGLDAADQGEQLVGRIGQPLGDVVLQAAASPRLASWALRAACRRAKSSPAWCEERVSGLAATIRKPLDRAISARLANSSGCTKRSIGACLRVGCRYWPMVMKSTPAERMSSITCMTSSLVSPRPTITPDC